MPTWAWALIVAGAAIAVAVLALGMWERRRTRHLKDTFGPEYERAVADGGSRHEAESELASRERRRADLEIRSLPFAARRRYQAGWGAAQGRFVDAPRAAVQEADRLVTQVMRERGYPMEDFEQRAAAISVDHPHLVQNFRSAHAISVEARTEEADTEDLRRAMVHYRALFEELLAEDENRVRRAG